MRRVPVLAALLVLAGGAPARGAVSDYLGKRVAQIQLVLEGHETTDPSLADVIETKRGEPLSMVSVRESISHLFSLGRFEDVRVDASLLDDGRVALRYELVPLHPVTSIELSGRLDVPGVDQGALRALIRNRFGMSPPLGRSRDVALAVADALRERGYLNVTVAPRADVHHAPERATLVLVIEPGPRTTIASIQIVGAPSVSQADLLGRLDVAVGSAYERDRLAERIGRYLDWERGRGHYEAKVVPAVRPGDGHRTIDLTLTVVPGPRVRLVFAGDPLPSDRRAELVPIEREGSADEDLLEDSSNRIEEFFRAQGYRDAVAPHTREEKDGDLVITFTVTRGRLYRVARVEISGNETVPLAEFEPVLRLRDGQPFSGARLDGDVATIESLYLRRGFSAVRVQSAVDPRVAEANAQQVPLDVRISIREGVRTLVGEVRIDGNQSVPAPTLAAPLGLQPGRPYFDAQRAADRDAIHQQYANLGYPGVSVEARPPAFSADRSRADVVFAVREGPRVVIDHVLLVGNVRTSADTVRRELQFTTGDPLSVEKITESQRRLAALGLFRSAHISELRHGEEARRDVLVVVEEAPATTVAYGGGVEVALKIVRTDETGVATERLEFAPRASFEITRRNLFGRNRSVSLFSSLALRPKTVTPTDASGGFGFPEYRVLGTFREPRVFDSAADAYLTLVLEQQVRSSFNFSRRTGGFEVARRLSRRFSVSGSYQIQRAQVFDVNLNPSDRLLIDRIFPQVRLSSFSSAAIADDRNDPVDPATGQYFSLNGQVAGRAIGSEVGFAKTFLTAQVFRPLPATRGIVFAGSARLGMASGFPRTVANTDEAGNSVVETVEALPASERFFAGGDTTVRGFALDELGTRNFPPRPSDTIDKDGFPIGGNAVVIFNAELRVPLRGGLGVVAFLDSGNVFARAVDINLGELRSAVGFGIRYKSPFGPLRIDLGFKIHRRDLVSGRPEGLTAFHISFGQAF